MSCSGDIQVSPQFLEIAGFGLLVGAACILWNGRRPAGKTGNMRNGKRRDIWDEVEGRVISIGIKGDAVVISYEFLTPLGSHHSEHRFVLDVSEPYQFGTREADMAHAAERWLRAYPVGSSARVRYNPRNVKESVVTRPRAQTAPAATKVAEITA